MSLVEYLNVFRILPKYLFLLPTDSFNCRSNDPSSNIMISKSVSTPTFKIPFLIFKIPLLPFPAERDYNRINYSLALLLASQVSKAAQAISLSSI
jgi:hypothetical protein